MRKSRIWEKYWKLTIVEERSIQNKKRKAIQVDCTCECGWKKTAWYSNLRKWDTKSCWCIKGGRPPNETMEEKIGKRIGMLTIQSIGSSKRSSWHKIATAICKCDCWTIKEIEYRNLMRSWYISCWCHREKKNTHGMRNTRSYRIRRSMKLSCDNPNHRSYHRRWGKGITYPSEWEYFSERRNAWKNDYSDEKYFIRINPFKDYSIDNCKREIAYNVSCFDLYDNF